MSKLNIGIAGLGNVGSALVETIEENKNYFFDKTDIELNIVGISARTKVKKRNFNISNYTWYDDPREMSKDDNCNVIVELIGEEKGISYEIIETALKNKKHVVTGNKALIANHGKELFKLANTHSLALSYEAAVAGGIPVIKTIKNSISLDRINKISGILNGTTNYILTKMQQDNLSFDAVLKIAKEPISMETPIGDDEDSLLKDFIADENVDDPSQATVSSNMGEKTREALKSLTAREEKVLRMRFGLDEVKDHTLEEVGQDFDVTRERIRQIEAKALRKLRHPSRSKLLKSFYEG